MKKALKDKNVYVSETKHARDDSRKMLGEFYRKVLHNTVLWDRFDSLVKRIKDAKKAGANIPRLTCGEFQFCTSLVLTVPIAYNLKRSGNLTQLPLESTKSALHDALAAYQRENPKSSISSLDRRVDLTKCVAAVFDITASRKKNEVETFCVLHPKHIRAMLQYSEYIRKYCPLEPTTDTFFLNSRGQPLGDYVCRFVDRIGRAAKIKGLKVSTLRSLVETENFLMKSKAAAKVDTTGSL